MTQLDLARQMGVTDKAVSKWERDLSIPEVGSLPKLAELLGVSVEELLRVGAPLGRRTGPMTGRRRRVPSPGSSSRPSRSRQAWG